MNFTQRFVCQNGVTERAITNLDLQDLKCVATSATSATRIIGAVKLNSIKAWCANSSATASNTIEVQYFTDNPYFGSSSKIYSDTAVGTTNVAYVHSKPLKGSYSGSWLPNIVGTQYTVATITCPTGTIVDVNVIAELIDEELALSVTGLVSVATVGILYGRRLDSTNGSPEFLPLGVNYI